MNKNLVFNVTGRLMRVMALILLLPMLVSLIYREKSFFAFLIVSIFSFGLGLILTTVTKKFTKTIYAKDGFVIVSLAWVVVSIIGALPFYVSGEVPSLIDAIFESASGFSTTGASVIEDVEVLSHGILFWRSFTHWIGGMGVLVFMIAFVSSITDRSIHILRAEMPGPIVGKITPRSKDTSKVLYLIYIVLTFVQIVLLWCGDMNLFESIVHTFGTAGTGGFGVKGDSIASYSSYSQWVITIFMFIFGINFNIFYLWILKRFKAALSSSEFWCYFSIVAVSIVLISFNISGLYPNISETVRTASFQVVSIISTTGYTTANFDLWPTFSKSLILLLMFLGACAGATAGGLKISRVMLIFKVISKEFRRLIHPRSVSSVKLEGKEVDETTSRSVTTYLSLYIICILVIFLILSFVEPFDFETNFTAAVTCFNNVGPGFAGVGPASNFAMYSGFSKLVLSFAMLLGRLEIFPLLIAVIPSTWKKK
ncbi:MAG: TrkH family potassium uptake protein [Ruminococcaceae bacterium]|nr:TrkH family potassium uptake protein [Oscillospiraceae bacterium]